MSLLGIYVDHIPYEEEPKAFGSCLTSELTLANIVLQRCHWKRLSRVGRWEFKMLPLLSRC